jgi:hypothetical protein
MLTISQRAQKRTQLDRNLQSYNLKSIVNFPTRINLHSSSTIDNILIEKSYFSFADNGSLPYCPL